MAALKAVPNWVFGAPQLGLGGGDLGGRRSEFAFALSLRTDTETLHRKWECFGLVGGLLVQRALTAIEEEESSSSTSNVCQKENIITHRELQKNFTFLPRPLSITNLSASSGDGSEVRIAYKGLPGAFSEVAALKAYPQCEAVPCDEFEAVLKAVELWLVNKAIIPIESSIGGSVHRNYDLLLRHRLHIVGEVQMVVNHCLMGLPGVRKEELKRVLSHPQALAHCEITLSKLGVVKEGVGCCASAAQFLASYPQRNIGAVASSRAAEIYGLNILAEKIQCVELLGTVVTMVPHPIDELTMVKDDSNNVTRFLILAREPIIPKTDRPFKTSIVFTLEEGPGVIFKALAVFAMRDINLTKIESRPQRKRPLRVVDDSKNGSAKYFNYLFYIDFAASMAEPRAQNALGHLQEYVTFLKVLGCYPIDMSL